MGTQARIALLLAATACLLVVMVDWAVEELSGGGETAGGPEGVPGEAPAVPVGQTSAPTTPAV